MGMGPAGGAGVLHTSGKTTLIPPLPLWAMPMELANVFWLMVHPDSGGADDEGGALAAVGGAVHQAGRAAVSVADAQRRDARHQRPRGRAGVAVAVGRVVHAVPLHELRPAAQKGHAPLP